MGGHFIVEEAWHNGCSYCIPVLFAVGDIRGLRCVDQCLLRHDCPPFVVIETDSAPVETRDITEVPSADIGAEAVSSRLHDVVMTRPSCLWTVVER